LNIPLSTENVFRIGSLTKQFTAVATLQLMEKGQLSLDDDITDSSPTTPFMVTIFQWPICFHTHPE